LPKQAETGEGLVSFPCKDTFSPPVLPDHCGVTENR